MLGVLRGFFHSRSHIPLSLVVCMSFWRAVRLARLNKIKRVFIHDWFYGLGGARRSRHVVSILFLQVRICPKLPCGYLITRIADTAHGLLCNTHQSRADDRRRTFYLTQLLLRFSPEVSPLVLLGFPYRISFIVPLWWGILDIVCTWGRILGWGRASSTHIYSFDSYKSG